MPEVRKPSYKSLLSRVANVVRDSNTLLTHERYMKMNNLYANTFLIQTISNYFWVSEVRQNLSSESGLC